MMPLFHCSANKVCFKKHLFGYNTLLSVAAIIALYVVARALLCPQTGGDIFDGSLLWLTSHIVDINYLIIVELLAGTVLLVHLWPYSKIRVLGILLFGFSLTIAIRTAYATDPTSQYVATNIVFGYFVLLASFWLGQESRVYRKAFPLLLLCIFMLYGVRALVELIFRPYSGHRLDFIFNHPNHLANMLSFAVIYCFSIAVSVKEYKHKILMWVPVTLLTFALIHTFSRGAWLGCLVGLTACVFYLKVRVSLKAVAVGVILLAFVTAIALANASPSRVAKRFSVDSPDVKYSAGNRLLLWHYTARIIHDHWLIGIGMASLGPMLRSDHNIRFRNNGTFSSAMNNYLTLAAEAGIPALILYIFCLIYAFNAASRCTQENGFKFGINAGLASGVYSMLVFAMTTYTLGRVYASVLVWSALGYVISQKLSKCQVPNEDDIT